MMPSPMQGVMPRPLQSMQGMMPGARPPMQAGYRRPPMPMPVVEPKRPKMTNMDRVQQDNDQKMIESLLSRWYEVRKAGIELTEKRIKERGTLLKKIREETIQQQQATRRTEEQLIQDRNNLNLGVCNKQNANICYFT
ncbi:uncharacterized protein [Blastocystis hominis]|uniref:Uncharacterized protein n=1 Tax=Blastocystis hominis TaxID=12968 RepID=D8M428_BLAHO|nr:uncharacterized protein [Blastocystis hominis]CBK22817.2 unnamed protein product [Blastocystis hominis]|eukprot:XP_012896865.1 uncharacterized protein [Blastocystis hominis]